jgi:hypothetical protein
MDCKVRSREGSPSRTFQPILFSPQKTAIAARPWFGRSTLVRRSLVVFYVLIFVVSASMPAFAGKGASRSGSSIQLAPLAQTLTEGTWPHFGDRVTFLVSTSRTDYPWVQNRCWQNGTLVLEQWHGFFDGYMFGQTFTLGPTTRWTAGAASCEARLMSQDNGRNRVLAATSYQVAG